MPLPYSRHQISDADIQAVVEVLRSDWLTQGPKVLEFEEAIRAYCGCKHAIAVNNATSALHLYCAASGLKAGDTAVTSDITFVATANAARHCGATIELVDVGPAHGLLDLDRLEEICKRRRPALVMPVHLAGASADMKGLAALAAQYEFKVLEDASHALGARYGGLPVGACRWSDAAVFSLHPVKMITAGEGGLLVTNDDALAQQARSLREHGLVRDREAFQTPTELRTPSHYEAQAVGFNHRLSDIQAALAVSQLQRLDSFVAERRSIRARYRRDLDPRFWTISEDPSEVESSIHLCVARLPQDTSHQDYHRIFSALRAAELHVNLHYIPMHRHPTFAHCGSDSAFPEAAHWARTAISIPCFPGLSADGYNQSVEALNRAASQVFS